MRKPQLMMMLALVFPLAVSAQGWQGAEAEKTYDKQLAAKRAAEGLSNDVYIEIHKDRRIYVFTDAKEYADWRHSHEMALAMTQIGGGPDGETLVFQLSKDDVKAKSKNREYQGASQRMWSGELKGAEKGFYGEVARDDRYYVFDDWKNLHGFRESGEVPCGITDIGAGPVGRTVVYVQDCKAAARGRPDAAIARFKNQYGLK
jgi:hypothetical protein